MDLTNDPIPSLIRIIAIQASVSIFLNTMLIWLETFFAVSSQQRRSTTFPFVLGDAHLPLSTNHGSLCEVRYPVVSILHE
jgi:hypothetical protein